MENIDILYIIYNGCVDPGEPRSEIEKILGGVVLVTF